MYCSITFSGGYIPFQNIDPVGELVFLIRTKVVCREAAREKQLAGTPRECTGELVAEVPVYGAGVRSGGQVAGVTLVGGDDRHSAILVHAHVKQERAFVAV